MGQALAAGRGVARDEAESLAWFRKAADQNEPRAQTALGVAYITRRSTAGTNDDARALFEKAAATV